MAGTCGAFCVLALVSMLAAAASAQAGKEAGPVVWTVSDMERVGKTEAPAQDMRARDVVLHAARGECAAFQVVVRAPQGGLTGVSLEVSDLTGRRGSKITEEQVARYREHYVYTKGTAHWDDRSVPLGAGWYADALIPFLDPATGRPPEDAPYKATPATVAADENQPYWVDIPVPRTLPAGKYTGTYVVTSDQGRVKGRITLNVWGFTLPLQPSERSAFLIWDSGKRDDIEVHKELLRHRMMPLSAPSQHVAELVRDYGLSFAGARFWSGADQGSGRFGPAPTREQCAKEAGLYPAGLPLIAYTADEITGHTEWYDLIKEWARSLHTAGIKQLITVPADPALFDDGSGTGKPAVDIWVMLGCFYDKGAHWQNTQEAIRRGMEAWSYTCLNQDGFSPKWTLDFPPIHFRAMQGFMNQSMGFTGVLYWAVDRWGERDAWADPADGTGSYPGDGKLAYPGGPAGLKGIAPSLRMKWIRKGMEDYEYVELLKKAEKRDLALQLSGQAAVDFKHWSQDPAVYESVRRQIAEALTRSQ